MILRRGLPLLAVLALAACTEEAAVTPATPVEGDVTTTSSTVATPPTTVAPESTPPDTTPADTTPADTSSADTVVGDTTAPTTTVAPTTTTPATGNPTSVSTEYFVGGENEAWLYIGRWTGNAWETNREEIDGESSAVLVEPTAETGDDVFVNRVDAQPATGTIDGTGEACADGRDGPVITPDVAAPDDPGFGFAAIAFPADWSTRPRPVGVVDTSIADYVAAGSEAFDDLGIDTSSGAIEQLLVSDLDGDGDSEAVVVFEGDGFSALLLIDTDSGATITVARSTTSVSTPTTVAEGDTPADPVTTPNDSFRTLAVSDLNGDGVAELVGHTFVGSSSEVTVYTYDGSEVTAVLTAGC